MLNINQFKELFKRIKGKRIAIVYIFEGDDSSGFKHFFIWKSNILTQWMNAVQELNCMPLILDVRTFIDKAINKTLPHIDFVLNMNSGTYNLSTMALVPSTCSAIDVPCIPCDAVSIVTGESKSLSNLIANAIGIRVPNELTPENSNGIFRPDNLGNSLGIKIGEVSSENKGLYQEFIRGYDVTTPVVYNALTQQMELLPSVIYLPESNDLKWFHGEREKNVREGYRMRTIDLDDETSRKYLALVNSLSVRSFCRIDSRLKCDEAGFYHNNQNNIAYFKDIYFIEINVMPTIQEKNSFSFSFDAIDSNHLFYPCIMAQKEDVGTISINSFLLASSMMFFIKTKY